MSQHLKFKLTLKIAHMISVHLFHMLNSVDFGNFSEGFGALFLFLKSNFGKITKKR